MQESFTFRDAHSTTMTKKKKKMQVDIHVL